MGGNKTHEAVIKLVCPIFSFRSSNAGYVRCLGRGCAAWQVAFHFEEREDHSGGKELILKRGFDTGRQAYRQGGPGNSGYWKLDEVGYCQMIEKGGREDGR